MMENNKGITLISLAIMIVVLLILAAVGMNYNSDSLKFATLTKLTTELEIINTQISILNQNKSYQAEYLDYGLEATEAELISEINNLLDEKLIEVYNISTSDLSNYKTRFQYCSAENINQKLGIDGIEGNYLVNIQNKIVISFDGIKYQGKRYYTLEELEKDGLAKNSYKVEYYRHENPYIPQGCYYVGGTWDTGYVISDLQDDKYTGAQERILTTAIANQCNGNLYMWIPIEEESESNINGVNWSAVTSDTDYENIETILSTYVAQTPAGERYADATLGKYAYSKSEGELVEYPVVEEPTEDEQNNILSSIYSNGGLYINILFE